MPVPSISKRFGAVVRKKRSEADLSQELLAEKARLHPTYVSMIERGLRNPTLDVAARLAKALRTPLGELIEEAESAAKDRAR